MTLQISDKEIEWTEQILLPSDCCFNDERREFIKCLESRDVVACPGSGKTTALLAKLLILSRKLPLPKNQGICVLTHTNVAINEIKKRAGGIADTLFAHPNYFGTIQGFVNKFLAMPFYSLKYGKPIQSIDNAPYYDEIERQYNRAYSLKAYFQRTRKDFGTLGAYWLKHDDLQIGKNLDEDIDRLGKHTPTYQKIEEIRQGILAKGILSFNDAYSLSLHYIENYPNVVDSLRKRFRFVFIDEMQDTDDHQIRIFSKLFEEADEIIYQRLGDPNQAIYQSDVESEMQWNPTEPFLPFSDSHRYGEKIARILDKVRVNRSLSLLPNEERDSIAPHLILFPEKREEIVLPHFGYLIRQHGLHRIDDPIFKAVGWIGKDGTSEGKRCLRSYHSCYQKELNNQFRWFSTLLSYCYAFCLYHEKHVHEVNGLFQIISEGIVKTVNISGLRNPESGRPFTVHSFKTHLRKNSLNSYIDFKKNVSNLISVAINQKYTPEDIRAKLCDYIRHDLDVHLSTSNKEFLNSDVVDFEQPQNNHVNKYFSDEGDEIEIATVHSVKGETHTATLYLETLYYKLDSERIVSFCTGEYSESKAKQSRCHANLKVAHVAFSRPTHLLAFACEKDKVSAQLSKFENAGWIVHDIS